MLEIWIEIDEHTSMRVGVFDSIWFTELLQSFLEEHKATLTNWL